MRLDDWQANDIDGWHGVTADGLWVESEAGELVARQNGKGEALMAFSLVRLFLFPRPDGKPKLIVHTAHEFKTAIEAYRRLRAVILASPFLARRVLKFVDSHGEEGIELRNGNRIRYLARSKSSGRGFTIDDLIIDEAQELSFDAQDALTYAQSAVPNPQTIYTGTVPKPVNCAEVWTSIRDRGRRGDDPHLGWREYSPTGSEDPDVEIDHASIEVRRESNPALGTRIPYERLEKEYRASRANPESYAGDRLAVWPNPKPDAEVSHNELDMEEWGRSKDAEASLGDAPVLSVSIARGGLSASISAASRYDDEHIFVEHKETRERTLWIPEALKRWVDELGAALVVLDEKNCVSILTDLKKYGIEYLSMNVTEIGGAHALMVESVNGGLVVHRGQEEVTESLRYAGTRKIGTAGMTWDHSDPSKPITQAQSITHAHWGVKKLEAWTPKRTGKVW